MNSNAFMAKVFVTDQRKALEFYCDILGLFEPFPERVRETLPDLIELYHSGGAFGILLQQTPAALIAAIHAMTAQALGGGVMVVIPVNSADELIARLRTAGIPVERDKDLPWGRHVIVVDPFGNRLQFSEKYPRNEDKGPPLIVSISSENKTGSQAAKQ
jgi:catechol 2,3-dioxygenase-like lactoylglutathione lyase family enzyme